MRTVARHQDAVRALLAPLAARDPETVRGISALAASHQFDRVLATDVRSPIDLPPFDNSQMDGFAVRIADVAAGASLPVAAPIAAGSGIRHLEPGTVAPIMTGAPTPTGADAIVRVEAATPPRFPDPGAPSTVAFDHVPDPGEFVRRRGSDIAAGDVLLPAGTRLGPAQWGALAASGVTDVDLLPKTRVLVVSTGDEITTPGTHLEPGQVYDANGFAMAVAVAESGADVIDVVTVHDDAEAMRAALSTVARQADLILTTGGVSKGVFEVVREVFENAGVTFESVAVQPGGPQGLGLATLTDDGGHPFAVPVVAFPGNPVSALVSFELFLRPVLRALHGLSPDRPRGTAPLAAPLDSPEGKHQVRRGILDARGRVELVGGPGSHLLQRYATSTLLVHIPVGAYRLEAGAIVETWSIN